MQIANSRKNTNGRANKTQNFQLQFYLKKTQTVSENIYQNLNELTTTVQQINQHE